MRIFVGTLVFANLLVAADPAQPSIFRITSANAREISVSAECNQGTSDRYYGRALAAISFTWNGDLLTRIYKTKWEMAGKGGYYGDCESAIYNVLKDHYPRDLASAFLETKNGDVIVERFPEGRPLCFRKALDLFGSATEIYHWQAKLIPVSCP